MSRRQLIRRWTVNNSIKYLHENELLQVGVHLAWHGMTEESLEAAISEVLGDPGYQAAVARLR